LVVGFNWQLTTGHWQLFSGEVRGRLKRSASKAGEKSNANENKQLISPSIAENAVCAANFAPFLHFF
jgi:hypothetical protein